MILATLTTGWGEPQASQGTFCWYGYEDLVLFCHDCTFLKKKEREKQQQQQQEYLWCILCLCETSALQVYLRKHFWWFYFALVRGLIVPCGAYRYTALSLTRFIWRKASLLVQITPLLMFCECFFFLFSLCKEYLCVFNLCNCCWCLVRWRSPMKHVATHL